MSSSLGIEDRLFIYLTGAVQLKDDMGYFCMYDHNMDNPTTGIAMDSELLPVIQNCNAKNILFVVDCQYSELFFAPFRDKSNDNGTSFQVLSTTFSRIAFQDDDHRGILTTYLLKALRGEAFGEENEWIGLAQVVKFVQQKMNDDGLKLVVQSSWIGKYVLIF